VPVASRRWLWALAGLLLMVAALAYLQTGLLAALNIYDEGIILYGAVRVIDGQVPYRDFWTQYSPGQLYVLSALFTALGKSVMVARLWDIVIRAALALMIFALSARLSSVKAAAPVWVLAVMWVQYYGFFGYPIFVGVLLSLASLYAFIEGLRRPAWMAASGVLLGFVAIFRHDMAVYVTAAQFITFVLWALRSGSDQVAPISRHVRDAVRRLTPWLIGALVVLTPVVAYFLVNVPAGELLQQLFVFPLVEFPKVRDLPYPELEWLPKNLPFYAPVLVYTLALVIAIVKLKDERSQPSPDPSQAWGIIMVVLFGVFGFNQARVRSDEIHTVQFFLPALLLLPVLWRGAPPRRWLSYITATVGVLIAIVGIIDPINLYVRQLEMRANPSIARTLENTLPIAQGALVSPDHNFAVRHLQTLTQPGDKVYVGLSRHDRVFANDAMFYFLLERHSPTRYHELHPGLTNTEPVQREMIADIERNNVKYVVLTAMFEGAEEPNDSSLSTGVTLLDDYLRTHYQIMNTIGAYRIYVRRS
jgi:hypothetical protein